MKAKTNTANLIVCPTYGNWVLAYDPKDETEKWHINPTITGASHQIGPHVFECTIEAIGKNVWKVQHDGLWKLVLDLRLDFDGFVAKLKDDSNLAMVARIFFALRIPNTEIDTQLTPIDGDYTNVLEALEKHRSWALEPNWMEELKQ